MKPYTPRKITKPVMETVTRTREVVVKPARYKHVDTGRKKYVQEEAALEDSEKSGIFAKKKPAVVTVERPIFEKVLLPPVIEKEEYEAEVWVVYTGEDKERHEFNDEEAALDFYEGAK